MYYVVIMLIVKNDQVRSYYINVTGPEKTGLIYTKYTYSYYGANLFFCVCYPNSVNFIEFLRILCIYDELCVKILFCHDEILHFKDRNLGQILHVNKTCFLRPGHKYNNNDCFNKGDMENFIMIFVPMVGNAETFN